MADENITQLPVRNSDPTNGLVYAGYPADGNPDQAVEINGAYGIAGLDANSKVPLAQVPTLGANPSVTAGLTAKNGSATTYLRSDAAPAIDQTIVPTWTGIHTFNGSTSSTTPSVVLGGNNPEIRFFNSTAPADQKYWRLRTTTSGFNIQTADDASGGSGGGSNPFFSVGRTGVTIDSVFIGPSTNWMTITPTTVASGGAWTHTGDFSTTGSYTILQSGGNGVTVTPSASGGTPSISAVGVNPNVTLDISAKGASGINLKNSTAITGNATVTGSAYVAGLLGSANNTNAPGPTNSGITLGGAPTWALASFYDQSVSANNRTVDMLFINGGLTYRFVNDARNGFLNFLTISGGQGSGVTGITSTSGSGEWAHTGEFSSTKTVKTGGYTVATLPAAAGALQGARAFVTDAAASPVFLATVSGGGSTVAPVFCNGSAWVYG